MIISLDCLERKFDDVVDVIAGAVNEDLRLLLMAQRNKDDVAMAKPGRI